MKLLKPASIILITSFLFITCNEQTELISPELSTDTDVVLAFSDFKSNPILTKADSPNYPVLGVASSFILNKDNKYLMWYTNWNEGKRFNIQFAKSLDGINWTPTQTPPVLNAGLPGTADSYGVYGGPVFYENSLYKMFYTGISSSEQESFLGLATSSDGINWTKQPNPIIKEAGKKLAAHSFIKVGDLYILYYSYTKINYQWGISIAISNDGINWERYVEDAIPITERWEQPGPHFPAVIQYGQSFLMLYGSLSNRGFGLAVSKDGLTWEKSEYNPVFTADMTRNFWSSELRYPFILKIGNEYRLYYTGLQNGILAIGYSKLTIK